MVKSKAQIQDVGMKRVDTLRGKSLQHRLGRGPGNAPAVSWAELPGNTGWGRVSGVSDLFRKICPENPCEGIREAG